MIKSEKLAGSGVWQSWIVIKILTDEVYTGDMVQGKRRNIGHKHVAAKPEDWVVVRGTHEPLISREMFDKVHSIREQVSQKRRKKAENTPYSENILRGKVFCGGCGKRLQRSKVYLG